MELTNEFRLAVPPSAAWDVLTDLRRVAPCVPGARLQDMDGDECGGALRIAVGPAAAEYTGRARFVALDHANKRAILTAEGHDPRLQSNARATITATLVPDGVGTRALLITDLEVGGTLSEVGSELIADVSVSLLAQFVACLEPAVLFSPASGSVPDAVPPAEPSEPIEPAVTPTAVRASEGTLAEPEPMAPTAPPRTAPGAKRMAPIFALVAIGWLLRTLIRRRRR